MKASSFLQLEAENTTNIKFICNIPLWLSVSLKSQSSHTQLFSGVYLESLKSRTPYRPPTIASYLSREVGIIRAGADVTNWCFHLHWCCCLIKCSWEPTCLSAEAMRASGRGHRKRQKIWASQLIQPCSQTVCGLPQPNGISTSATLPFKHTNAHTHIHTGRMHAESTTRCQWTLSAGLCCGLHGVFWGFFSWRTWKWAPLQSQRFHPDTPCVYINETITMTLASTWSRLILRHVVALTICAVSL